jgi:hypothetical protein
MNEPTKPVEPAEIAAEPPPVITINNSGAMTRRLLRRILRELQMIRRLNDGGLHAAEALGRPRPMHPRRRRRLVWAKDAADTLGVDLIDLVEIGEEARAILGTPEGKATRIDGRPREGRTFRVRRSPEDR